jgi:hypothetical protein
MVEKNSRLPSGSAVVPSVVPIGCPMLFLNESVLVEVSSFALLPRECTQLLMNVSCDVPAIRSTRAPSGPVRATASQLVVSAERSTMHS